MQTAARNRNIEINPNPIFRHLIVRLIRRPDAPPVHAGVAGAVPKHQPQRLGRLGVVGAAGAPPERRPALGQVPAQVAGAVARRIAPLREALAEHRLGGHDHGFVAAIEEEVVVLGWEREVGAGVEAEGSGGPEVLGVVAVPHWGVSDFDVALCVAYGLDWVCSWGGSQLELAGSGAVEDVAVVWAAAAVVDSEGVVDLGGAAGSSAFGGLGLRWAEKQSD